VLELWLEPAGGKRTRAVLEYGHVVMGIVVLDEYGDAAVLRALAVQATHRRQGHGRSLVEFIVRHAYQTGVGRMYAASGTPWFAEEVGFEVCERELLPEDARRLPGIIDAPRNAFVFELTPTRAACRTPERAALGERGDRDRAPQSSAATAKRDLMRLAPAASPTRATRAPTFAQGAPRALVPSVGAASGSVENSQGHTRRANWALTARS